MSKLGNANVIQFIEDVLDVQSDIKKAKAEESAGGEKITWLETSEIVLANAVKAVRTVSNIDEIGKEFADTDDQEAAQEADLIVEHFGGTQEVKEAVDEIMMGAGHLNMGIQKLLALRK